MRDTIPFACCVSLLNCYLFLRLYGFNSYLYRKMLNTYRNKGI